MVGPEEDGDLSPEYRAKAAERAPGEEKIDVTGMGRLNRIVVPVPEGHFTDPHRQGWLQKRRAKMIEEIEPNRRGEYTRADLGAGLDPGRRGGRPARSCSPCC